MTKSFFFIVLTFLIFSECLSQLNKNNKSIFDNFSYSFVNKNNSIYFSTKENSFCSFYSSHYLNKSEVSFLEGSKIISEYFYNSAGKIVKKTQVLEKNGVIKPSLEIINIYDAHNRLLEEQLYNYDSLNLTKYLKSRELYFYNAEGKISKYEYYETLAGQEKIIQRISYSYNQNLFLTHEIIEERNLKTGIFEFANKINYSYNSSNLLSEILIQKYDNGNWLSDLKNSLTYDANGNLIQSRVSVYQSVWKPVNESIFEYDQWNQRTLFLFKIFSNGLWINEYKFEYDFLGKNKLSETRHFKWDSSKNEWIPEKKEKQIWQDEKLIAIEYYVYELDRLDFLLKKKIEKSYNASGRLTREDYYYYDKISNSLLFAKYATYSTENENLIEFNTYFANQSIIDSSDYYLEIVINNNDNQFYFYGLNGKFYYSPLASVNKDRAFEKNFIIFQNYPNPFNAQSSFKFILPISTEVEIEIHAVDGTCVFKKAKKYYSAGENEIKLDLNYLSSGNYFFIIKALGSSKAIKFTLIK